MGLTDAKLRAFRPSARVKLADEKGLYLLGTTTGARLWRFDYRWRNPATGEVLRKTAAFGPYPEVSLAEARAKLAAARAALRRGDDPMAQRKAVRQAERMTFGIVAAEWMARREGTGLASGTMESTRRVVDRVLVPVFGARPLDSIASSEVLVLLEAQTPGNRPKTRGVLGAVYRDARARGLTTADPVTPLVGALPSTPTKHHPAVHGERAIGALLRALDVPRRGHWAVGLALRVLPYVFVRPGELRGAEWSEIDLDGAEPTWRLPAERTKMERAHVVPLALQVVELLRQAHERTGGEGLVFPGRPGQELGENTLNRALRGAGYDKDTMVPHGFRAVFSTHMNEMGERPDLIEHQLAHVEGNAVRAAYQRSQFLPERREMMQRWADELDRMRALPGAS